MSIPKDTSKVTITREFLTAEKAKQLLEYNTDNRNYDDSHALEYAQYMRADDWYDLGNGNIKITKSGKIIDGQHTLHAIIKNKKGLWVWVSRGLDEKAFKYLDTQKRRSIGDVLKIEKFPRAARLGAAVRLIILYQQNRVPGTNNGNDNRTVVSHSTILAFAEENRMQMVDIMTDANNIARAFKSLQPSTVAFLMYIFSQKHKGLCNEYFDLYATGRDRNGEKLDNSHPIAILRSKLVEDTKAKTYSRADKLALAIWAWNYIRSGDTKILANKMLISDNYTFPKAK